MELLHLQFSDQISEEQGGASGEHEFWVPVRLAAAISVGSLEQAAT